MTVGHNLSEFPMRFHDLTFQQRERSILDAALHLFHQQPWDRLTIAEVATHARIGKGTVYKHFPSKEDLACAAMVWVMRRAQAFLQTLPLDAPPLVNLRAVVAWTMGLKLAGEMPSLPSLNSSLRTTLTASKDYMDGLMEVSDVLGAWIEAAQAQGAINPKLPAIAVLYTLFARACDPVLEFLKMGDLYNNEEIINLVMSTCFDGLSARPA